MKKIILLIIVVVSSVSLIACGAGQKTASVAFADTGQNAGGTSGGAQMSEAMQLAIGTLMLDKTDYPIDSKQAAVLLFLWKGARSLSTSETAAIEEKTGLVKQIQAAMTSDQLKAIQKMDLKVQDLPTLAQGLGIDLGMPGLSGAQPSVSTTAQSSNQGPPADFGGGIPIDGGGPGGPPPGASNTASSASSSSSFSAIRNQGSFLGVSSSLLDQVIKHLEAKAQ